MKYSELSSRAKQIANEHIIDSIIDEEWWDYTYEEIADKLKSISGIELDAKKNFFFSLSFSQGDYFHMDFDYQDTLTDKLLESAGINLDSMLEEIRPIANQIDGLDVDKFLSDIHEAFLDERISNNGRADGYGYFVTEGLGFVVDDLLEVAGVYDEESTVIDEINDKVNKIDIRVEEIISDYLYNFEREAYNSLRNEYDALTDPSYIEVIAGEFDFNQDGTIN